MEKIKSSEITPEHIYLNRRQFMKGIGALTLGTLALSACAPSQTPPTAEQSSSTAAGSGCNGGDCRADGRALCCGRDR